MLLTIKESKEAWKSPDGQRTIWEVKDGDGNVWQTMSGQIAKAIGQTLDLTTRVSDKGKTYLITPPQDESGASRGSTDITNPSLNIDLSSTERFEKAVDKFSESVERLIASQTGTWPSAEALLTEPEDDLPPASLYDKQMDVTEIVDDLT